MNATRERRRRRFDIEGNSFLFTFVDFDTARSFFLRKPTLVDLFLKNRNEREDSHVFRGTIPRREVLFNKESEKRKAEETRVDFNLVPKITIGRIHISRNYYSSFHSLVTNSNENPTFSKFPRAFLFIHETKGMESRSRQNYWPSIFNR